MLVVGVAAWPHYYSLPQAGRKSSVGKEIIIRKQTGLVGHKNC
jgi:hypothetical protein